MGLIKKLAGDTVLYGASSIIGRFLNYLLVPLYTSVFIPSEYGVVTELYAYVAFLNVIYVFGLETTYFRFCNEAGADEQKVFNQIQSAVLLTTAIFSIVLISFSGEISSILGYSGRSNLIVWMAIILAIDAVVAIPFARLRQQGKARKFATTKLINIIANVFLNLAFIVWLPSLNSGSPLISMIHNPEWGVEYIFISNLVANTLLILLLAKSFYAFKPYFSFQEFKPFLLYSYPILFTGLAGVTNEMLSRAMLKYWLPENFYPGQSNLTALGIFGACYKIAVFMTLAVQAFRYAAEPFFFSNASNKNSPELFATVMNWFVIFGSLAFLVISTNLDIVGFIFLRSEAYREGLFIVPYLLMGGLFLGIYYNLSVWYKLTDKTIYGAIISSGGALITILFNLLLIPVLGYLGSAITTLLTYFAMSTWSYLLGQKHYPIPYYLSKAIIYIVLSSVLILICNYLNTDLTSTVLCRIGATLVFILFVYFQEKQNLRNIFNR